MEPFWGYLLGVKELLLEKLLKFKKKEKKKAGQMQSEAAVEIWVFLSLLEVLPPNLSWVSCYVFFFSF